MKRIKILAVIIICCLLWSCLFACDTKTEKTTRKKTIEEIEQLVRENFFDENGKAIMSKWGAQYKGNGDYYNYTLDYHLDEVTGFTVSPIKNVENDEYDYYLVEFEPSGFILGDLRHSQFTDWQGPTKGYLFRPYPSPYKVLKIPEEDRYSNRSIYTKINNVYLSVYTDFKTIILDYGPRISSFCYQRSPYGYRIYIRELDMYTVYNPKQKKYLFAEAGITQYNEKDARKKLAAWLETNTIDYVEIERKIQELIKNSDYEIIDEDEEFTKFITDELNYK